jgi:hypothetical protein
MTKCYYTHFAKWFKGKASQIFCDLIEASFLNLDLKKPAMLFVYKQKIITTAAKRETP